MSAETLFLLGVTAGLGILGGLFYLIVHGWIPDRRRVVVMTVFFGLIGGGSIVRPNGIDFTQLSPLPLAGVLVLLVAMLVWSVGCSAPTTIAAWCSRVATWIGRALLVATAVAGGAKLVRDSLEILS